MERFAAAAAAGFTAVELQFPYDHAAERGEGRAREARPDDARRSTRSPGNAEAGEFGLACVPGREAEFAMLFRKALDYVVAIGGRQIHVLAGKLPPEQRPAGETVFVRNLMQAADLAAEKNITLLIEPINARDRPGYYLNRVEHAADIIAKAERREHPHPVRFLSCADRRRRSHAPVRGAPAGHRPCAGGGGALAPRAGRGRGELPRDLRHARSARLSRLCRSRIPAARAHRGRPRLGPAAMASFRNSDGKQGVAAVAGMSRGESNGRGRAVRLCGDRGHW